MKAVVNQEECIGCGFCARTSRKVFRMTEDWTAEAYADVDADNLEAAQFAALKCPAGAITFTDAE